MLSYSMRPVLQLAPERFDELKAFLAEHGFSFESRPHQVFLARKGTAVVNLYENGKIVFGGSDMKLIEEVETHVNSLGALPVEKKTVNLPPLEVPFPHIGTDEVGKGDYFGPLVTAGVLATAEIARELERIGVKDSKLLSDTTVANKAYQIRKVCGLKRFRIVIIPSLRYNILIREMKNVNRLLGWAHARAIEDLLANGEGCSLAVADQFGDPAYIRDSLMARGRQIELLQTPKAERDVAVAAASILARDTFLRKRDELNRAYGVDFPKGSSNVIEFGKRLVDDYGPEILPNVAKLHFATTIQITGGILPDIPKQVANQVSAERPPRPMQEAEKEDERLECYNLISVFEAELRSFIESRLSSEFGLDWWDECVTAEVRAKAEKLAVGETKKGRIARPIDCLDFSHYDWILLGDKNWERAFKAVFQNKEYVRARLIILKSYRDPVAHSRGDITSREKGEVVGAIHWMRKMIRAQSSIEDFAGRAG
jgi:ribonuclease HIII